MKRIWHTTIILILLTLLKPAASDALAWQSAPPPPPPPSKEYFPDRWNDYVSEAGRFRARFPGKPKETVEGDAASGVQTYVVRYTGIVDYGISYMDIPKPLKDASERRQVIKEMKDALLSMVSAAPPRVVKESDADVQGHPGYFFHVDLGGKEVARMKWVIAGNRLYTILVGGRKGSPNELEGKDDFEKMAMAFINSFDLIQQGK